MIQRNIFNNEVIITIIIQVSIIKRFQLNAEFCVDKSLIYNTSANVFEVTDKNSLTNK